ncbi:MULTISPECIES: cytochrome c [Stappiaceae]|jgi:mono/diheme cytochrome c family protein|uniref:cytochrome c n=1 Tax=Stappiaceae TaxID=2821832 RepID=UPI00094B222A|nr:MULTISPECIES: cytochrome c [Stappiaceae]MBO9463190.1 cytochrome c [Labrenzia sp. R5_0]UES53857.1 c-type cytochrome [Roseibium aggregatum]UFI06802.1 cytochrome c [Roseibium aggregatum]
MKISENLPKFFVLGFFGLGIGLFVFRAFQPEAGVNSLTVQLPAFSGEAEAGEVLFNDNCAACHGVNATGTKSGPPLLNDIYNPGHHPDESFYSAAKKGVRRHHWSFGNMPSQPQVTQDEVTLIIRYVRELQTANGITYKPHTM